MGMLAWWWLGWASAQAAPLALSEDGARVIGSAAPEEGYELPCEGRSILVQDQEAWVACAASVVRLRRGDDRVLELTGIFPMDGEVLELFEREDGVWAVRQRLDAVPVTGLARSAPGAGREGRPTAGASVGAAVGTVSSLDRDRPVITLGRKHGLEPGDRVEFFEERARQTAAGEVIEEKVVAIGVVVGASTDAAIVAPGINQIAPVGTFVRPTDRTMGANTTAPPRIPNQGWLRLDTAGLVSLGADGGGLLFNGALGYRFKPPVELSLRFNPGWAGGRAGVVSGRVSIVGMVAFDHPYFAIGAGGGVSLVDGVPAGVFAQMVRLGAVDGLSLTAMTQFASNGRSQPFVRAGWQLDNVDGVVQIPLSHKAPATWLTLHGRGSGYDGGGGDLGVRIRARGNGWKGTLTFWPHVGAHVVKDWVGPAMGLGVDLRL